MVLQEISQVAQQPYEQLVANIDGIVWEADPHTFRFTFVSQQAERFLGYPLELWLTPGFWTAHLHPDDRDWAMKVCLQATSEKRSHALEYRMIAADGRDVWLRDVISMIVENGEVAKLCGVMVDVTERRHAEEALGETLRQLRTLMEHFPDFIARFDDKGRILYVNPTAEKAFGMPLADFVGKTLHEVGIPGLVGQVEVAQSIERVLAQGVPNTVEMIWRTQQRERVFEIRNIPEHDEHDRNVIGVIGIAHDVTEQKRLEEQFRQAQKMEAIGQLAGGVAHDFNNLLTVINGFSELALRNLRGDDRNRELLADIKGAGQRAAALTRQLLAFSRKQLLQPQIVSLNALLSDILRMLHRLIGEDICLNLIPDPTMGPAKVDPGQFEQAIVNLVVNARDAMPDGGRLTIETHSVQYDGGDVEHHRELKPGLYAMVAVSDSGHGMDAATKARIFEPFFTTKGAGKGTGLGLAMVYGFVKQSGGHVEVDSDRDHGTTIRIYLPCVAEAKSASEPHADTPGVIKGTETVLLVEDEDAVRHLSKLVLTSSGYTVLDAHDGLEAIRIARNHQGPIHMLVTDLVMPRMGGRQLAELLAQARPEMRRLFMSGYADEAGVHDGDLDQGAPFLHKPFNPFDLVRKVREELDAVKRRDRPL